MIEAFKTKNVEVEFKVEGLHLTTAVLYMNPIFLSKDYKLVREHGNFKRVASASVVEITSYQTSLFLKGRIDKNESSPESRITFSSRSKRDTFIRNVKTALTEWSNNCDLLKGEREVFECDNFSVNLWIDGGTVNMKVLSMNEKIRGFSMETADNGFEFKYKGWKVLSTNHPELRRDAIFLRGNSEYRDDLIVSHVPGGWYANRHFVNEVKEVLEAFDTFVTAELRGEHDDYTEAFWV